MLEKRKPERRDRTATPRPAAGGRERPFLGAIQKTGISVKEHRKIIPKVAAVLEPHPPKAIFSRPFHKTLQGNKKSRATLISLVESGLTVSRELVEKKRFELSTPTLRT